MADPHTGLAAGFDPRGRADFEELLGKDGVDRTRLVHRTADGIEIEPLYLEGGFLRTPPRAPGAVQRLGAIGAEGNGRIVAAIDHALSHGSTGVLLQLSAPGRSDGLAAEPADWKAVLAAAAEGPLHLRATTDAAAHARAWLESRDLVDRPGCGLGLDPFTVAARTGRFGELEESLAGAARLGAEAITHPAHPRAFALDSEPFSAAGATTAQSVGALLAGLVAVLRALEAASVDPARAFTTVELCLRLDARFFEQTAALRALRLLHARIARACGVDELPPLFLSALPAPRVLSRRDPWVNMLRQTATTFAALSGGADAVAAFPYDALLEETSVTARRVARNTPTILVEESRLGLVEDPAAGSWFLDQLTRELAGRSWEFFRSIEAEGGLAGAMGSGWLLARLEQSHQERRARLVRREEPRTGVSEFARLDEPLPAPVTALATPVRGAWPRHGDDDPFERLRAAADRHAAAERRPRVFVARVGTPAHYAARETWLVQLVAAAGIEAVVGDPQGEPAREFASSGARTAILCTDDATLKARGAALTTALSDVGRVWAAGRPVDGLGEAGVERFVHLGVDVVELLEDLLAGEGVEA